MFSSHIFISSTFKKPNDGQQMEVIEEEDEGGGYHMVAKELNDMAKDLDIV